MYYPEDDFNERIILFFIQVLPSRRRVFGIKKHSSTKKNSPILDTHDLLDEVH